ncbi:MAG: class I SAM-dependent methyltransferase [Thermodesulfobacteriota bacterium]
MESIDFNESRWADHKFSQDYRDEANYYLPFRQLFIEAAKSVVEHFLPEKEPLRLLDLGCGDGFFIDKFGPASSDEVLLVDGSTAMLEAAQKRLRASSCKNIRYIHSSFQELLARDPLPRHFDFIFSSLAIHHLSAIDKVNLYNYIYNNLEKNGVFINYDVVLAPSKPLESWYISFWQEFIERNTPPEMKEKILRVPYQYKDNPDNIPDTLEYQLKALKEIGFSNVDCYFKLGVFCLFGGTR